MKKALTASKIILVALSVFMLCMVVGVPLLMTFTTNDKAASFAFFAELLIEFLPFVPFFLFVIVLVSAIQSLIQYKLGIIQDIKKRLCLLAISEIILLITIIVVFASIAGSNSTVLH